jgi:predicted metal-dependent peptidase
MRVSRRLPGAIPGRQREPTIEVALIVDTSGSIYGPLLTMFLNECRGVLAMQGVTAVLMAADAAVGQIIEPGEPFPDTLPGGGGTDFRPALAACEQRESVSAVIYCTDGAGQYPVDCRLPVLWVLSERGALPPFGQSVYFTDEN